MILGYLENVKDGICITGQFTTNCPMFNVGRPGTPSAGQGRFPVNKNVWAAGNTKAVSKHRMAIGVYF
jgi:hypothetical protein